MKCGPRPSRAMVEAGASTQLRRKKELPMAKRVRSSSLRLTNGKENAFFPVASTVVAPPVCAPSGSSGGAACSQAPVPAVAVSRKARAASLRCAVTAAPG